MFVKKIVEEISKEKLISCRLEDEIIYIEQNGNVKYKVQKNGTIQKLGESSEEIFYLLFDIISKTRAEHISQFHENK